MNKYILEIKNVTKKFNDILLFEDVNIKFSSCGLYGLQGESGSGKSSFLYLISLLDQYYQGEIIYFGKNIKDIKTKDEFINKHIGFVYQNPIFIPDLTLDDNLALVRNENNVIKIKNLLKTVGLEEAKLKKINMLSGGEKMRLSIVRSLSNNPEILLCDEPTASLNEENAKLIMDILKKESLKRLVIIVSHDQKLLKEYADYIYELKNNKINLILKKEIKNTPEINEKKTLNKLKFSFIIKYIFAKFKSKKWQTFICLFTLCISFFTIGFSFLLKEEISSEVKETFSSFMDDDEICLKGEEIEEKNEINSVSINEAQDVILHSEYFYDCNYLYQGDFENQFKDANYLTLLCENSITFYDVGFRSVIESILISDIPFGDKIYPYRLQNLNFDEGVLGLRNKDIIKICSALDLEEKNVNALSNYLTYHTIDFCFTFQNEDWNYNNEVLFRMRGFFLTNEKIIIAHSEKNYVENFVETKMKLPISTDLKRVEYLPWTIKRATYIRVKKEYEYKALKEYFFSDYYMYYDLKKVTGNLNSSFLDSSYHQGKYILTYASKGKIPYSNIQQMINDKNILNAFPVGKHYPLIKEAMASGFSNSIFLASNQEILFNIENYYSEIKENVDSLDLSKIEFAKNVSYGNLITSALQKGVKLETKKPKLLSGRYPLDENEIMISTILAKKLFKKDYGVNERIYLMFHDYDEIFLNQFKTSSLIISGVFEDNYEKIYQEEYWYPIFISLNFNYPLEEIYVNSFICRSDLTPNSLNNIYDNYFFEKPLEEIYQSVDSVIEMIQIILNVFYVLIYLISFGILFITLQNIMHEAEKEIGMLKSIGIKKKEVFLQFLTYGSCYTVVALFSSLISLLFINFILRVFYFNLPFTSLNIKPYLIMIINALILTIPLSVVEIILPLKKDALSLLKRYY